MSFLPDNFSLSPLSAMFTGMGGFLLAVATAAAGAPEWLSLILGPGGALVVGAYMFIQQRKQAEKDRERADRMEAKFDSILERTVTLAAKADVLVPQNIEAIETVTGALGDFRGELAKLQYAVEELKSQNAR